MTQLVLATLPAHRPARQQHAGKNAEHRHEDEHGAEDGLHTNTPMVPCREKTQSRRATVRMKHRDASRAAVLVLIACVESVYHTGAGSADCPAWTN